MKTPNRDLLVLLKDELPNDDMSMEFELEQLNELLFRTETIENFCLASEVIDLNKYEIIEDPQRLARILSLDEPKAFQFICNKN